MQTYNQYVQREALRQTNNEPLNIYRVRRPLLGEVVYGHTNFSEAMVRQTYTEECADAHALAEWYRNENN